MNVYGKPIKISQKVEAVVGKLNKNCNF